MNSDWHYAPLSAGTWSYEPSSDGGGQARFGPAGTAPLLTLACDRATRTVRMAAAGAARQLTITTSYGARTLPAASQDGPAGPMASTTLPSGDGLLDEMAFSRGRLMIGFGPGGPALIVPAWAELGRIVEDCRR